MKEPTSTPTSPSTSKKNIALPVIAALGLSLLAFGLGRNTASSPPASLGTNEGTNEEPQAGGADQHGHGEEHGAGEIKFEEDAAQTAGVRVAPVTLVAQTSGIPFNGQIAPDPNGVVRVSSLVPGRVASLNVSVGDRVRRGQVLAVIESRAVGEAQSGFEQATARFQNALSNLDIVQRQARAGVFSRGPVEAARRAQIEAQADVRAQDSAVRQARISLDNTLRLARTGSYSSPVLEAARGQSAQATQALRAAEAALSNARASVTGAQREVERRTQLAAGGAYSSRPVEQARQVLVAAQSARAAAQSEVSTTRANLARAKVLAGEGLVSQRDVEAAQQAFDTATARVETAQSDQATAQTELSRQQRLASTNAAGASEVQAAQSTLAGAQADVRTRTAEVARARESVRLADAALSRERAVFRQNIANRREVSTATSTLENASNALTKARATLEVANAASNRERSILSQNLNNTSQMQAARAQFVQAQSDLRAARTALALLKSAPGGSARVPIVAPISGVVQDRERAEGEVLDADAQLLTIVNLGTVAVEASLPERDIARVRDGSPVKVSVESLPGRQFIGRISVIGTQLNAATRTLSARALLPNTDGALRPGLSARGQIVTSRGAPAVTVPANAIQTMEDKSVVFVPTSEPNTFKAREVEPGATEAGRTVIKAGLRPGERVVVEGAFMVKAQAMKAELGHED